MKGLRATMLTAICLMVMAPAAAVGQTLGAEEALGLGGRVEVAETSYALTLPDDWVHIRPSAADIDTIKDEAFRVVPDLAPAIEAALSGGLGFSLLAFGGEFDPTFSENCNVLDRASDGSSVDRIAAEEFATLAGFGDLLASGPELSFVDLPSGRAGRLDLGLRLPEFDTASTSYLITDGEWVHTLTCTDLVRPTDAWRSIAEGFEFLEPAS